MFWMFDMFQADVSIISDCLIRNSALNKSNFSFSSKANTDLHALYAPLFRFIDWWKTFSHPSSLINDYVIILMEIDLIGHQWFYPSI